MEYARHGSLRSRMTDAGPVSTKAEAGLKFPPGVDVVLKFCPYRQPQTAVHERDLVLGEDAVNVVGFIVGNEIDRGKSLDDLAWTPARAQPPNDVLMGKVGEVVNQVDIEVSRISASWGPRR